MRGASSRGALTAALGIAVLAAGCGGGGGGGAPAAVPQAVQSVCGGEVTSTPKLCQLAVSPNPVRQTGSITITLGVSDLEGDIDILCIGIAQVGADPLAATVCDAIEPAGTLINEIDSTDSIPLVDETGTPLLAPGGYQLAVAVGDAAGHTSEAVSTTFTVIR